MIDTFYNSFVNELEKCAKGKPDPSLGKKIWKFLNKPRGPLKDVRFPGEPKNLKLRDVLPGGGDLSSGALVLPMFL